MNGKKNIVHITTGLTFGGFETFLYNYISHMDRSKFNSYIISHEPPHPNCIDKFKKLGFTIYHVPPKKDGIIKNLRSINDLYKTVKPDIVHAHLTESNYAALFLAKMHHVKTRISHAHVSRPHKNIYQRLSCKLTSALATHYVACGKAAAEYLYGKKQATILPNAFEISAFRFNSVKRSSLRKKLAIKNTDIVYGHVGRFSPEKNQDFVLTIFAKIIKKYPNSKLLLVGDGKTKPQIKKQVHTQHLDKSVIIINATEKVADYYQAMDIFIFPSQFEGLGSALIEAQISGLPCIISDVIPKESNLSKDTIRISLNAPIDYWCNMVAAVKPNRNRTNIDNLNYKDYDINTAYKKLEKLYE